MSQESHAGEGHGPSTPLSYGRGPARGPTLAHIGGALGIAACFIGLVIFLVACAGFDAVFALSLIPLALALPGLVLAIVGGVWQAAAITEDTPVLAALFVNLIGIVGALVLIAVWRGWPILADGAGM